MHHVFVQNHKRSLSSDDLQDQQKSSPTSEKNVTRKKTQIPPVDSEAFAHLAQAITKEIMERIKNDEMIIQYTQTAANY